MIDLTMQSIANLLEVRPEGGLTRKPGPLAGISIDSRTIQPGECFVAIRGPRFDGHDYISEALSKGAAGVIHSRPLDEVELPCPCLRVDDTLAALQKLARHVRTLWGGVLLAITGSMGKTTTRNFIAHLLQQRFKVLQSAGNWNNEFGVPLSLLQLEKEHEVAVLELGMNHPGEIRLLSRICRPDIAMITNVAAVHLEFFSGLEGIAEAKGEIIEELPEQGRLVYNVDDFWVHKLSRRFRGEKISFSVDGEGDVSVDHYEFSDLDRMDVRLRIHEQTVSASLPFAGRHFLYNFTAAAAAALAAGLEPAAIESAAQGLEVLGMRGRTLKIPLGSGTLTIWDDSYNSNPEAVKSVLQTLAQVSGYRRKIVALGEMLELGPTAPQLHRQTGREAAHCGASLLIAVGEGARSILEGAIEAGLPSEDTHHFSESEEAAEFLSDRLRPGDLLLCKGSRGVRMDRIVSWLNGSKEVQRA